VTQGRPQKAPAPERFRGEFCFSCFRHSGQTKDTACRGCIRSSPGRGINRGNRRETAEAAVRRAGARTLAAREADVRREPSFR
jgi:hypothetical protein